MESSVNCMETIVCPTLTIGLKAVDCPDNQAVSLGDIDERAWVLVVGEHNGAADSGNRAVTPCELNHQVHVESLCAC